MLLFFVLFEKNIAVRCKKGASTYSAYLLKCQEPLSHRFQSLLGVAVSTAPCRDTSQASNNLFWRQINILWINRSCMCRCHVHTRQESFCRLWDGCSTVSCRDFYHLLQEHESYAEGDDPVLSALYPITVFMWNILWRVIRNFVPKKYFSIHPYIRVSVFTQSLYSSLWTLLQSFEYLT